MKQTQPAMARMARALLLISVFGGRGGGSVVKRLTGILCLSLAAPIVAGARTPATGPEPAAEHKKLEAYVGKWRAELDLKPSRLGPGGRVTGLVTCEWLPGRFHVTCRSTWQEPSGDTQALAILTYDALEKAYTVYLVASTGATSLWRGSLQGDTWTYEFAPKVDGEPIRVRLIERVTPDVLIWTEQLSVAGGQWVIVGEGKETKIR